MCQTPAEGAATLRLAISDDPTHSVQAQCETLLTCHGRFHTRTAVTLPQSDAEGQTTIPIHPETQEHLFEIVPAVLAMPVRGPGGSDRFGGVRIHPIERHRRGVL